jgi:uncharacterized protein
MKRTTWIIFGLLAMTLTAHAASFNCAKAATKVEKLICADAEISKLDEELNAAYKVALHDGKQADTINQAQKQWIKGRNGCSDAACVKGAYVARLSSLAVKHTTMDDGVAAKQNVTPPTDEDWHCELESTPLARKYCEQARDAKPFAYEIKSALPGKGYSLCELILANMQAQSEPMSCEFKIAPKYQKYFSLPEWEDIDPWADIDLLWKADVMGAAIHPQRKELEKLTREQWLEQFKRQLQQNNLKPIMRRARFDLNGDGKDDWVLAYQLKWNEPCNPWKQAVMYGYTLIILGEDGKPSSPASLIGADVPFFFSLQDPRYPGSHTYRFRFNSMGRGGISVDGGAGGTACHYDLLKLPTHSMK